MAIEHNLKFPTKEGNVQHEKAKEHVTLIEEEKKVRDPNLSIMRLVEMKWNECGKKGIENELSKGKRKRRRRGKRVKRKKKKEERVFFSHEEQLRDI